ncbi:RNA polymerase sigma factor [Sporomusa sphaeroides]|uniref:RNA polymerase sigma factor SigM n=1 Tax=Sporomusa sphaeroides DSM 2875 TaxID=1337886 RepID=A0ABP2CB66_9FIRM|nr:sigma-70 family RNA polymerase sigma factor [Sporomusa sphaeroides]OLS55656.1 RNA polymerase sigma factor SigM [Sporomusa sphaeroides DSM 2875]CVK19418.1 RNA polymerase sigma factor SigM [Sporomusa sphaeroides DSM 2875]
MVRLTQMEEGAWLTPDNDSHRFFDEIYREYFPRIYHYVLYRVSNYHDADDLSNEIFVKLFTSLNRYQREKASLPVWIFTIARNTVIDYYRRNSRPVTSLEAIPDFSDSRPGPEDKAVTRELRQHLREALASLSQREREIIALKFWSEFSNREIAGFIGISESHTGVILFRAMRRLRLILESQGVEY